jgi:DNA-binding transcriptional LysR family regulator
MLQSVNLNLLPVLARLLATGSVTKTADELGVSPSVVSRNLGELRRHFGDALLVRAGSRLVPTLRARELEPALAICLRALEGALRPERQGRGELRRVFVVNCDDSTAELLAVHLHAEFAREAPKAALHFLPELEPAPEVGRGERVDFELGAGRRFAPETNVRTLLRDPMVCLVRDGHPLSEGDRVGDPVEFARWPQVLATAQLPFAEELDAELRRKGLRRHVALVMPSFHAVGRVVAGGDLVAILPRTLARELTAAHGGVLLKPPVSLAPVSLQLGWHPRYAGDSDHAWLRGLLVGVLKRLRRADCVEPKRVDWEPGLCRREFVE